MQNSNKPNSIISVYISKQNIGVSYYNGDELTIQCGLIQSYITASKNTIDGFISEKMPQIIVTNNDKHSLIVSYNYQSQFPLKIAKIDQRGLQDDIIENNIALLKFNPVKEPINNKPEYIKLMRQHSEGNGLNKQKYKALGMLLYYLLNQDSPGIISKVYLNDIRYFFDDLFKIVQISTPQLQFFQIIKQQVHPSLIKGKGRSKQGFSILSLYQTTLSSTGSKKILKNIFKNPTYDRNILQSRLNFISWLKSHCSDYKMILKNFKSIHSVDTILNKFIDSRVEVEDWRKLVRTFQSMIILHKIVQQKVKFAQSNIHQIPQFLQQFFNSINWGQIAKVHSAITINLDLQQGIIKRGVDPQLDQLKKTYDNLPHLLTLYARQQNWSQDFRIVFMSQIGYLIRVPHEAQIPQSWNWNLQFIKNSGKFYCSELTNMLDNQYGDIYGEITDREKKISFELQNIVSEHSLTIQKAYWKCAQFQCFLGISIISNGMCRPRLSSQSLIISRGWHLLLAQDAIENNGFSFNQALAPKQKVYNSQQNLVNTNYSNRVMLITGPNGSGKTVYLKQNTIITYLAHLGLYVPAQFAEIPLVDKIALVQSKRSIYNGTNGFQNEIASLSKVCTPGLISNKSLVLIDQFGASIDSIFAKKIICTLINFITNPKVSNISINTNLQAAQDKFEMPLVMIITHLTQIISQGIILQNYHIRYLTMDMQKGQTYLYKIKPGLVKKGYGIQCAKSFMEESFIKRAEKYWQQIKYYS